MPLKTITSSHLNLKKTKYKIQNKFKIQNKKNHQIII